MIYECRNHGNAPWDGLFKGESPVCPDCGAVCSPVGSPMATVYHERYDHGLGMQVSSSQQEKDAIKRISDESGGKVQLMEIGPGDQDTWKKQCESRRKERWDGRNKETRERIRRELWEQGVRV